MFQLLPTREAYVRSVTGLLRTGLIGHGDHVERSRTAATISSTSDEADRLSSADLGSSLKVVGTDNIGEMPCCQGDERAATDHFADEVR